MPFTRSGKADHMQGKRPPRKEKRQLVRWDQDLDNLLLLTIQAACNQTGVKIPWKEVAEIMGTKFTEGAIVQHLSKLRIRREAAGQRVPPPLRRSVPAAANTPATKKGPKDKYNKTIDPNESYEVYEDEELSDDYGSLEDDEEVSDEEDEAHEQIESKRLKTGRESFSGVKMSNKSRPKQKNTKAKRGDTLFVSQGDSEKEYESSDDDGEDSAVETEREIERQKAIEQCANHLRQLKAAKSTPSPRPSRITKLPLGGSLKYRAGSANANPTPTLPTSSATESSYPIYMSNDPAIVNVPPTGFSPAPSGQISGSLPESQPAGRTWPGITPALGGRLLAPHEYTWSPHAPAFASGRPSAPINTGTAPSAPFGSPQGAVTLGSWEPYPEKPPAHRNSSMTEEDEEDEEPE
ncbi:hypothetical protein N7539_005584 [Penicillium diatomitis]|uniref:Myb-like domain-containing protein n=1 Tax=Penicillium diatomitis TaxID=2819901 RepID=A0A9X0BV72_9EURO|nr:uncharacterized protein N7539_005584 [Penicillium diatomitis]KAJ5485596.1 hypothetical protein N7539_005584 [Penicillium diatomitis]